ncbi:hypothetical protein G5V58_11010 [Nocardioides anomalus]|uniref:Uncharacterized protein n=1 Tax=Nocardioides anomalus TaxID=2712223 RepID=A0A6G6WDA8_9ACTN|nr:hypothetical protein [Nocardioides anomalus]QIG43214.1 hypothetical protein G5V58_11010 [Nocardioides anomalus]
MTSAATELDPFDLPDWLGDGDVVWASTAGLSGHAVAGSLAGPGDTLACDLLAVDQAYPAPVLDEPTRTRVHQVWRHGQVLLLSVDERATVAAPGTSWSADGVLETLTRVARAVGADPARWSVRLGLRP